MGHVGWDGQRASVHETSVACMKRGLALHVRRFGDMEEANRMRKACSMLIERGLEELGRRPRGRSGKTYARGKAVRQQRVKSYSSSRREKANRRHKGSERPAPRSRKSKQVN